MAELSGMSVIDVCVLEQHSLALERATIMSCYFIQNFNGITVTINC